jgi:hypothetical protein
MHRSRWVNCSMASAALLAVSSGCTPHADLDVLPGAERLVDGAKLRGTSSIFDGARVRLHAARGETLGVVIRLPEGQKSPARLELPQAVAKVTAFSVKSLEVREPSTEMYGPSRGPGSYPDILVPLVPQEGDRTAARLWYFDVEVLPDAAPARVEGVLTVGARSIPVELRVSSAHIDLARNPLVWVFYLPAEIARAHGLPDDDGPRSIDKEREYGELFRAHGAFLASDLGPSRFPARSAFVHDVRFWPVAVDTSSDDSIARDTAAFAALFRGSPVVPFAVPVDEPHDDSARTRAQHVAEVMGRAGGGPGGVLRGVTDEARDAYGESMDVFISPKNIPARRREWAGRGLRFWTYNGRPPAAGSMILDGEGPGLRTWGPIAERYGVDLWYAWEGLYFSDRYNAGGPTDVTRDPVTFDERRRGGTDFGNGDGVLAYPGPLPSLRLKALRTGLEDRLLLEELRACGGGERAERILRGLVPRALGEAGERPSFPESEDEWQAAHEEILGAIESECHGR